MNEKKKFEKVVKHDIEFLPDGSRIYTFQFEDGESVSWILTASEIRQYLKAKYEQKSMEGATFTQDQYEEKREEYILSIDDVK